MIVYLVSYCYGGEGGIQIFESRMFTLEDQGESEGVHVLELREMIEELMGKHICILNLWEIPPHMVKMED